MSLIPYLHDLEKPFRLMERDIFGRRDFFDNFPFDQIIAREFGAPFLKPWHKSMQSWDMFKPLEEMSAAMSRLAFNEMGKIKSDDEMFQVNVDVQHFSPEEVNVKVADGHVIVQGKHEEKEDAHGYVSREFIRRYALPQGCLPDTVESKLSSDGILTVTAPKVLALPSIGERIIPVKKTGPVAKHTRFSDNADQ